MAKFLLDCVVCGVRVRVRVWTFYLEHMNMNVVF